jgi:hypothetical protein
MEFSPSALFHLLNLRSAVTVRCEVNRPGPLRGTFSPLPPEKLPYGVLLEVRELACVEEGAVALALGAFHDSRTLPDDDDASPA